MKITIIAIFLLALLCGTRGQSLLVTTYAYFDNFVGGMNEFACCYPTVAEAVGIDQPPCANNTVPPFSQARWGIPASNMQSGLGFQGLPARNVSVNTDFSLGTLYHFNFPIYASSAASQVTLNIVLNITEPYGYFSTLSYAYQMIVEETPNQPPCQFNSTVPCADAIYYVDSFNSENLFITGNTKSAFKLQGFKESEMSTSDPVLKFISNELQISTGFLFGRIVTA